MNLEENFILLDITYLLTYLLSPWSRVLLEKLTGSAASQEIPRIFGTRRFITVFTSALHLSLSWANSIQSAQPLPTSWRSILILSSHLRLGLPTRHFTRHIVDNLLDFKTTNDSIFKITFKLKYYTLTLISTPPELKKKMNCQRRILSHYWKLRKSYIHLRFIKHGHKKIGQLKSRSLLGCTWETNEI